jgi:hypothetical protein
MEQHQQVLQTGRLPNATDIRIPRPGSDPPVEMIVPATFEVLDCPKIFIQAKTFPYQNLLDVSRVYLSSRFR